MQSTTSERAEPASERPDPAAVEIVVVGDELLDGSNADTHTPWLAGRLAEVGRRVRGVQIVGDVEEDVARAVRDAARRAALVIVTGGLGPTLDDVTRHAVARAAGVSLFESAEALAELRTWFERAGRAMPDCNRRQALFPSGCELVPNAFGTAPGFSCAVGGARVVVLPGPPRELRGVYDAEVHPKLAAEPAVPGRIAVARLHFHDLSESAFAEAVGAWMERGHEPELGVTVKGGVLSVRLVARAADEAAAKERVGARAEQLREMFRGHWIADGPEGRLGFVLGRELLASGTTVTVAESCTGGRVASELTRVPGISAVLRESFVAYSNEAKSERLGVPPELLAAHGAVSEPVARAMAEGAARAARAQIALAVTGVAGPGGGSAEKPVGLVWFAVHDARAPGGVTRAVDRRWPPAAPRESIQEWAAAKGLALLLDALRR